MSRACVALARGDLGRSWSYHPFAVLLIGLALSVALRPTWTRSTWWSLSRARRGTLSGACLLLCLGFWLARIL